MSQQLVQLCWELLYLLSALAADGETITVGTWAGSVKKAATTQHLGRRGRCDHYFTCLWATHEDDIMTKTTLKRGWGDGCLREVLAGQEC